MEQLEWIERNGIRTLTFDDVPKQSASQKWDLWRRRFEELLVEENFIEMMRNTMEMIVLPLFEAFNEVSEDFDVIFEVMLQVCLASIFLHFVFILAKANLYTFCCASFSFISDFRGTLQRSCLRAFSLIT